MSNGAVLGSTTLVRLLNTLYQLEVSVTTATESYKLNILGEQTGAILANDSAATVQAALEALTAFVPGDVIVTGSSTPQYFIEFTGNYLGVALDMTVSDETGTQVITLTKQIIDPSLADTLTGALTGPTEVKTGPSQAYAYLCAGGADKLAIIDLADPTNLSVAGSVVDAVNINLPQSVAVNAAETLAYVSTGDGDGVASIDISTKIAPALLDQIVGDTTNLQNPEQVKLGSSEDYLYVASRVANKLAIIDVTNPAAISVAGAVAVATAPEGVAVTKDENTAFVANTTSGNLRSVDTTNKAAPALITGGSLTGLTAIGRIELVDDKYIFGVENGGDHIYVVDVSTPDNMQLVSTLQLELSTFNPNIAISPDKKLIVVGDSAFDRLLFVDISNPAALKVIGVIEDGVNLTSPLMGGFIDDYFISTEAALDSVVSTDISAIGGTETTVGSQVDASDSISNGSDETTNKQSPSLPGGGIAKEHILTDQDHTLDMNNIFIPTPDVAQAALVQSARAQRNVQIVIYDSDQGTREIWRQTLIQNAGNSAPHNAARRQNWSFKRSGTSVFTG